MPVRPVPAAEPAPTGPPRPQSPAAPPRGDCRPGQPAPLSGREKAVAIIANGIAAYSMRSAAGSLPPGTSLVDFVVRAVPDGLRGEVTADLVDEVFAYVSSAHGS